MPVELVLAVLRAEWRSFPVERGSLLLALWKIAVQLGIEVFRSYGFFLREGVAYRRGISRL